MELSEIKTLFEDTLKAENAAVTAEIGKAVDEKLAALREEIKPKEIHVGDDREAKDPKGGFKSLSEFTSAVIKAYSKENPVIDERLVKMQKAASGMSEGADIYGGYLVPEEYRRELWKLGVETSPIYAAATKVPMATNRVEVPYVNGFSDRDDGTIHGGIKFYWLGEAEQRTATKPTLAKFALTLHKAAGLFYATDELLADSVISIEPMIREMFADSIRYTMENVMINGTGTAQPLGILNASCLVSVAKEDNQAKDTVVTENILKMYARLYRKDGAFWLINQDVFPQLPLLTITGTTSSAPVYVPANGLAGAPYGTLLGLPVYFSENCDTVGDQGDIILGQWSQYLIGQKAGADVPDFASSIHLKFDYDETAFKFTFRVDGQPWWQGPLYTPHSANTLSPFIVLDARA